MSISIRRATPNDASVIVDFNCRLALESEGKTLDAAVLSAGVAAGLADASKALYFVAEHGGTVVGQTMVTFEWSDWRNGWIWWIQSVYVRADHRKKGVFRALYQHIHTAAKQDAGVKALRLYVEERNIAAQETYLNLGMKRAGYFVLEKHPL